MLRIILIFFYINFSYVILLPCTTWAQEKKFLVKDQNEDHQGKISEVINSITFRLFDGRKIRLIGLIPLPKPKRKDPPRNEYNIIVEQEENPIIPLEETAYDFINDLVMDKKVRLELDTEYMDPEGYILAYVFLEDKTMVNAEILRQGFSDLRIMPPNTAYEQQLRDAYLEAKKEKRGLQGN